MNCLHAPIQVVKITWQTVSDGLILTHSKEMVLCTNCGRTLDPIPEHSPNLKKEHKDG